MTALTEADVERAALGWLAAQRDTLLPRLVSGEVGVGDAGFAMEVTN